MTDLYPKLPHSFTALLTRAEAKHVDDLFKTLEWDDDLAAATRRRAVSLVETVRGQKRKPAELEQFLQRYGLNSEEGRALMHLAESLLRVPDARTADWLIRDRVNAADWKQEGGESNWLLKMAGIGMGATRKTLQGALGKLGAPVIRKAMRESIRIMGQNFVLAETIEKALVKAEPYQSKGYGFSFDMLGEGARTHEDAERYFLHYKHALKTLARAAPNSPHRLALSVKLSAMHPRYEVKAADECLPALTEKLQELIAIAAPAGIPLTIDAEEADRLDLSLAVLDRLLAEGVPDDWHGLGMAVQAYQTRATGVVKTLITLAEDHKTRLNVRLVKGAYWDTEIRRAQLAGLKTYPVFTRKENTDTAFLAIAQLMLSRRDVLFPQFATHNAHSMAAIFEMAGEKADETYEFQRLHGMGEALYDRFMQDTSVPVTIYAPCGPHEDLLPYLVRRLLENGANSSFVNQFLDPAIPPETLVKDPVKQAKANLQKTHPKIVLPDALYGAGRPNSRGKDLSQPDVLAALYQKMETWEKEALTAWPLTVSPIDTKSAKRIAAPARRTKVVGHVHEIPDTSLDDVFKNAKKGFAEWGKTPASERAACLERLADLIEDNRDRLIYLCIREAGKTLDDAVAEIREAVDFCRYYAMRGRIDFREDGTILPGPTGEDNRLNLSGRGVFVCISPWNFPLAIFTGQITAALMAGNAVLAKPAEQTPLIAYEAARLMHKAGIPVAAMQLLPGGGELGARLVSHADVGGVAFTGSTATARKINRALAAREGAIVPLIAETGGQNAMIVDSTALPEQVCDDALLSAFGSAGQRCSALRVLYIQDDIADKILHMMKHALACRVVDDPYKLRTDIGPVIDQDAQEKLNAHLKWLDENAQQIAKIELVEDIRAQGCYVAPAIYEIDSLSRLKGEVFGPILHVIRYRAAELEKVIDEINATGFGLTFGIHSRIGGMADQAVDAIHVGNAYVNRPMTGAVVGVQPFGGHGLSGTGPKAGGPHYLPRFAAEKVVSRDITRAGGNTELVSITD